MDTHDRAFRRRFAAAAAAAGRGPPRGVRPGRRGRPRAVDRRRPGRGHREVRRSPQAARAGSRRAAGCRSICAPGARLRMTFIWPDMLWLLLAVPALVAGYVVLRAPEEEGRAPLREPEPRAGGPRTGSELAAPPAARSSSSLALVAMLLAVARPSAVVTLPSHHDTVILAMDVSGSMRATDVAAQPAGRRPGRRPGLRRRAAAPHPDRRGRVRGHRGGRAGAHQQPGGDPRRDRPLPGPARDRHRQRDPGLAEGHLPGRRVRPPLVGPAARRRAARRPPRLGERAQPAGLPAGAARAPTSPPSSSC